MSVKTAVSDVCLSESCGRESVRRTPVWAMIFLVLVSCLLLPSCTSKAMQRQKVLDKPLDDDYLARIAEIRKTKKQLYGDGVTNSFLYNMDVGVLFHYAGMYDSSNVYLLEAEQIFDDLFTKSVSNEAAALLTNDNVRPYRSKPYELTFLHNLVALNFMAKGMYDEALVESRKMQVYFNEWERTGANDKKYHTDGMFHLFSALAYEKIGEADNSLISTYLSASAYKKGPVPLAREVEGFAYDRLKAGDRENNITELGLRPDDGPNKWTAKMGEEEIVIVGYAGKGPKMVEMNWGGTFTPGGSMYFSSSGKNGRTYTSVSPAMPESHRSKVRSGTAQHIKISLPDLVTVPSRVDRFSARLNGGGQVFESVEVNDINKQAAKALSDDFGAIVARTAIRAVIRAVATDKIQKTDTGNPGVNLLLGVGSMIYNEAAEHADVRMCFMLPQKIIVTRIPVQPGVHSVQLDVRDKNGSVIGKRSFDNIEVKRGEKKVLFNSIFQ